MRLQACVGSCVILLTLYRITEGDITGENDMNWLGTGMVIWNSDNIRLGTQRCIKIEYFGVLQRRKRAYPTFFLKMLAQQGVAAMNFLLSGAKKVKTAPSDQWVYAKRGDFDTAYWDFYRVIDKKTMKAAHNPGMDNDLIAARAGDRGFVFLARNPEFKDNPTIDVHNIFDQQQYGTIVYVKAKKDM